MSETLRRMIAHNVDVKIVTGDNELVTRKVASEIGFQIKGLATSDELSKWSDAEFKKKVEEVNVFTRVNPEQKREDHQKPPARQWPRGGLYGRRREERRAVAEGRGHRHLGQ